MKQNFILFFLIISFSIFAQDNEPKVIQWDINRLDSIGGFPVTLYGEPLVVETDSGTAVEFDGVDDGMLVESNPLEGAEEFSIEVVFKPYPGGLEEQRFIHIQQDDDNRALIELRSTPEDDWFLDTFIKSAGSGTTLYAEDFHHTTNEWWHACLVYSDDTMTHYVNGIEELSDAISFQPVSSGATSIGVRQNLVSWYKGTIKTLKVTHKALSPDEFLYNTAPVDPPVTGISENGSIDKFNIFPNPIHSEATIHYTLTSEANISLKVFNMQLIELVDLSNGTETAGNKKVSFNRGNLSAGVYLCVLQVDRKVFIQKLMLLD